jgi:hypothetical protein
MYFGRLGQNSGWMFGVRSGVMARVTGRWGKIAAGLASVVLAVVSGACSTVFPGPSPSVSARPAAVVRHEVVGRSPGAVAPDPSGEAVDIWVVAGSYHTGLVVPLAWLEEGGFHPPAVVKGAKWVNLSWGDRLAYEQERWLTPWEVMMALFFPTDSVMEIIRVDFDPRWVFPDQKLIRGAAPRDAGPKLAAFLENCRKDAAGGVCEPVVLGDSTWGRGCLMTSPHTYGFPRLCNSWTAGALEACGYSSSPPGRVFAGSLMRECLRQGFEDVPPLTDEERARLADFMKKTQHGNESNL